MFKLRGRDELPYPCLVETYWSTVFIHWVHWHGWFSRWSSEHHEMRLCCASFTKRLERERRLQMEEGMWIKSQTTEENRHNKNDIDKWKLASHSNASALQSQHECQEHRSTFQIETQTELLSKGKTKPSQHKHRYLVFEKITEPSDGGRNDT